MKNKILPVFIFALCFLFFSETKAQTLLQNEEIPKDLSIKLVRGACHGGDCPVYELIINAEGNVSYNGMLNTKLSGKADDKLSRENLISLIREFEKIDFFSLRNTYAGKEDGCTEYWSHHSWQWISLTVNGKTKEIAHDFGCSGNAQKITKALIELGNKIDKIVETKRWIGESK